MIYKKTFWMNVVVSIGWVMLCLLSFATDIDYVEHTMTHRIISAFVQLFVLANLIITASYMKKPNNFLRNLALFTNYSLLVFFVLLSAFYFYLDPNIIFSWDLLAIPITFVMFGLPAVINLKALKSNSISVA